MSRRPELEFAARTDPGLVRAQNEDALAIDAAHGLAVLADGMGGHAAGEVASGIAINVICRTLAQRLGKSSRHALGTEMARKLLATAVGRANRAIFASAWRQPAYAGMGTTLVAALFYHDCVAIAHVGDSRAYRIRAGCLEQLTRDHSLLQEELDAGLIDPEQARFAGHKNLLTHALGVERALEVEVHEHRLAAGDLYLLCSDGLSDQLSEQEMIELAQAADLERAAESLVQRANQHGGEDNISAILVRVKATLNSQDQARHAAGHPVWSGLLGRITHWIK